MLALLERPGDLITRDELRDRLWGDTFVDFDHSLGTAIAKLRSALGDSARSPRFIETIGGRGYRFIAPVTVLSAVPSSAQSEQQPAAAVMATTVETGEPGRPNRSRWIASRLIAGLMLGA